MKKTIVGIVVGLTLALVGTGAASLLAVLVMFAPPDRPESIAIDHQGNTYVSMYQTGEVRQIATDGTQSTLAGPGVGANSTFPGRRLAGIAVEESGNVYAALGDVPQTQGIWRIDTNGTASQFTPLASAPNGLTFDHRGALYVSASFSGLIYRIGRDGAARPWSADKLLLGSNPGPCGVNHPAGNIGVNGLTFNKHGDLLVANTSVGAIVRIPVAADGSAGVADYYAGPDCDLWGADGLAMDNADNLYVAANVKGNIARVDPNGTIDVLASRANGDPLSFPSAIAFGTGLGNRKQIFITNFAPPVLVGGIPGLVTMDTGVPGRPLP